jgi:anthranilate/para-aminobenzoate synthase component II
MKILLIDNYDSFTYNLYHYISNFKKNVEVVRNDKIDGKTILRKKYNRIVISPGPGNPNQAGNCLKIVKEVHKGTHSWSMSRPSNNWSGFWGENS